jgi:hypothetical protein
VSDNAAGVWFVFDTDWDTYPIAVYPDELSARRHAARMTSKVTFWPFGVYWGNHDWRTQ